MKKTINILFDASCIVHALNSKNVNRAGIFWVAYNVLTQFYKSPYYKITLLIPLEYYLKKICEMKRFISLFPKIVYYDKKFLKNNIDFFISQLKISFSFILILRILKNILLLILSKNNNILKQINSIDIYFSPAYAIPDIIKNNNKIKKIHILYDIIPLLDNIQITSPVKTDSWSLSIKNINSITYYFCISEFTKKDFIKHFSVNQNKIRSDENHLNEKKMFVTPIASSQVFYPIYDNRLLQEVFGKYGINYSNDTKYIFSFCSIEPRKNLAFTIKCFLSFIKKHKINNLYFYLGGAHFSDYINQFTDEISEFKEYNDKIIRLGYIYDEDVNVLYSNSLFFTYLSKYEGFGIPPLEAMQAGTPVICSNNSSLPEVVGDAAITIDYNSEEQCIKAFEDLYFNEDLRKHYIEKGLERGKLFSWEKTFDLMHKNITEILSENK
jgi:glycosyltransferase involved in cell wall biosynthesis